ncbi:MAG: SPW repeat protein, partial [Chloroflexi bacterium]|nr:SPW repeat protein [Chloroflexota bacterium]
MRQWTTLRTWPEMRSRWVDWANLILGVWLFISPWVLGTIYNRTRGAGNTYYNTSAASPGDFWWTGGAIVLVALWALGAPWARWTEWINMALAVWLFVSPWVLGFAHVR